MSSASRIVSSEAEELILVDADDDETGRRAMKKLHTSLIEKSGTG